MSSSKPDIAISRINALVDEGTFAEIGGQVTARSTDFNLDEKKAASDGVVTGYALINDSPVYIYSQDPSCLGGSLGEMHGKKIAGIIRMAIKMGAPVIGLLDSTGVRLEESTDSLNAFGEIFKAVSDASGVVPIISAVMGNCGGGLALIAGLSDFTLMDKDNGRLFVNSPNTLTGNHISDCDTSSALFQQKETGNVDFVGSGEEVLGEIRKLIALIPCNNQDDAVTDENDDANRLCTGLRALTKDIATFAREISDEGIIYQVKADYATDMITALISLNGTPVGVVGNNEEYITVKGARKAANFVNYCDSFSIPVISLVNTMGFKADMCSEKNIVEAASRLVYSFASATTPKISLITGKAFGSAYLSMNSKALGCDLTFAWKEASIGVMNSKAAAEIIAGDNTAQVSQIAAKYDEIQNSVEAAAGRGYVDVIIEPDETRKFLIGAVEMLYTKREYGIDRKHGSK